MWSGRASGPTGCNACPRRHASRSTHDPIGTMRPVSSASGMKSSGITRPRVGWFQRTSASNPSISPLARWITGWKYRTNSSCSTARCRSAFSSNLRRAVSCIFASKIW